MKKLSILRRNSMKYLIGLFGFLSGCFVSAMVILLIQGIWDFNVNIVDLLMLVATIVLSIAVIYLTKALNKKDIVRDLVVTDLKELSVLYEHNSEIFSKLQKGEIQLEAARKEVRMIFHKADLIIDCINKEIKESFPKFLEKIKGVNLLELTTTYYKWVTGGEFFDEKKFQVTTEFLKSHETSLYNTTSSIKLIIHKLIKFI